VVLLKNNDHIPICTYVLQITRKKNEGGFEMRDLKTYLYVAPVASAIWFTVLAGVLIEINRLFP